MTTPESGTAPRALDGLRVLEIAGALTPYCGKTFADLGADVVLIEPPGGCRLRRERPFLDDNTGPETSLAFAYHNTSKRGITLSFTSEEGCALFRELAAVADGTGFLYGTWDEITGRVQRMHQHGINMLFLQTPEFSFQMATQELLGKVRAALGAGKR